MDGLLSKLKYYVCNLSWLAVDVAMERYVRLFKRHVINFKLELCCFMASVRSGLLAFACLHIAIGVATLMFFAEGSFQPLLLQVLSGISEDPPEYGPTCMIVYAVELGSNVVLLCGIIRKDMVLLRVYMYFALGVLTAALMAYSVMFVHQGITVKFLIIASIGHQIYILLLLRSVMLEIKQTIKQNEYTVGYRKTSVRYSRPGSRDRYSVVIEPFRRRSSVYPYFVREPYRRSSSLVPLEVREPYRRSSSLGPYVKAEDRRRSSVSAIKESPIIKEVNKEDNEATVIVHTPAKEEVAKEVVAKEEMDKDVKRKEKKVKGVKAKRSIFGRKLKKEECMDKKDEAQNVTNNDDKS